MRLHVISDLHLDSAPFRSMDLHPFKVDADVIVVPGDLHDGLRNLKFLQSAFADKPVIFVPGNHEYYNTVRPRQLEALRASAAGTNVHLLSEDELIIEGVRFLGTTLWADFEHGGPVWKQLAMNHAKTAMGDFRCIQEAPGELFTPERAVELHQAAVQWLKFKLRESFDGKTVVVSHHACHRKSIHERYANDMLSGAFASDLEHLMGYSELWIHGHVHHTVNYELHGTRVIANPRGRAISNFHQTRSIETPVFEHSQNIEFEKDFVVEI